MLALAFPTSLDGYQLIADAQTSHAGGGGFDGVTVITLDAPAGKQFLGAVGSLVVLDNATDLNVVDVLPVAVQLVGSSGANCVQATVTANVPGDTRIYQLTASAIAVTQLLNPGH